MSERKQGVDKKNNTEIGFIEWKYMTKYSEVKWEKYAILISINIFKVSNYEYASF